MDYILWAALISLAGMGAIFGGGLAFASKKFYVEVDPRVDKIIGILPGANCGACGSPGCSGFARAVVEEKAEVNACIPGGKTVAEKIAALMGKEAKALEPMVAVVKCAGGHQEAKDKYRYFGIQTCTAANIVGGGHKACQYGCLGFGDCVKACSFGALTMDDNGLPVVNDEKCTGCGMCVPACPKKIISMIPASAQIYIACSSLERGKDVKEVCIVGCTGCGLCAQPKVCPSGAIKMEGYLPVVDYSKEDNLIVPKYKCPTNSFIDKIKYRPKFNIDPNCNSCGECLKICPVKNCIKGEEGKKFEIDQDLCIGCGWCVPVCEPRAIHIIGAIAYQQQAVA